MENYVGKRLDGRYEIMEVIGVGGMAVVYKAFDNIDHRIVAVKILKDEYLANADFKRRFMNESKAISVLSHPNIVRVFDVSYGEILQYIVMEYVDGISLKEYIEQQGVIDPREALYFVTQILRALQHAHDKGIVHRDIKPQNIMLISDGTIKVTDFGIARFSRSETRTMTDGAIGSVHYISPEQAKGSVTDAKTDLYAVGVMLYEMLTGRLPFQSDNAVSVALMQLHNDPVKPRAINPEIPVGLEQIIIRAMQKNQNDRYQSASEILMDIEAFKRNPNIKFDYSYYNDSVIEEEKKEVKPPVVPVKETPPITQEAYDESEDYTEDDSSKKKTIAVLCGVLCALIIFAVALITFFLPGNNGLNVPDLVGKNFYTEIMNNPIYADFDFEPEIVEDSSEPSGTVVDQSPAGGKIQKGSIIKIYISGATEKIEVPDVYGYEYTSAEAVLRGEGFEVKIIKEKSEEVEIGKVIRTSPKKGAEAESGSLITVFVATTDEIEPVEVPNLVGMTISEARAALDEVGLILDSSRTEYRPSSSPANTIIGHELIGEMALPGTSLAVFVSTGRPPETTEEETTDEDESTKKDDKTTKPTTTKKRETTVPPVSTTAPTTKPTTTEPTAASSTEPSTEPSSTPTEAPVPSSQPTQAEPTNSPEGPEFVEGEE